MTAVGFHLMERGNTVNAAFTGGGCQDPGAGGSQDTGTCVGMSTAEYHLRQAATIAPSNCGS
jgi:hypothetical protein